MELSYNASPCPKRKFYSIITIFEHFQHPRNPLFPFVASTKVFVHPLSSGAFWQLGVQKVRVYRTDLFPCERSNADFQDPDTQT